LIGQNKTVCLTVHDKNAVGSVFKQQSKFGGLCLRLVQRFSQIFSDPLCRPDLFLMSGIFVVRGGVCIDLTVHKRAVFLCLIFSTNRRLLAFYRLQYHLVPNAISLSNEKIRIAVWGFVFLENQSVRMLRPKVRKKSAHSSSLRRYGPHPPPYF